MPTYRACLVDVFDTVVTVDMPRYGAAVAGQAGIDPDRSRSPSVRGRCPRWRDA